MTVIDVAGASYDENRPHASANQAVPMMYAPVGCEMQGWSTQHDP